MLNFSPATVSFAPFASVRLPAEMRSIRPPVGPEASIVPLTVIAPPSVESWNRCAVETLSIVTSPVRTRKRCASVKPPASSVVATAFVVASWLTSSEKVPAFPPAPAFPSIVPARLNCPCAALIVTLPASPPSFGAETSSIASAPTVTSPEAELSVMSPPLV